MTARRGQIAMSEDELVNYLEERNVLVVATVGRDGAPHLTALWYVVRDGQPWIFTYARSQKVRNLERDPRATLLLESGTEYGQLRGAALYVRATIHRDPELVGALAEELIARYANRGGNGSSGLDARTREAVRTTVGKRVAVQFAPYRAVSWDHGKLDGAY